MLGADIVCLAVSFSIWLYTWMLTAIDIRQDCNLGACSDSALVIRSKTSSTGPHIWSCEESGNIRDFSERMQYVSDEMSVSSSSF